VATIGAMDTLPPLLRATPARRPYPMLEPLGHTTLVRRELAPHETGAALRLAIHLVSPTDAWRPI
jgi:hypothetical protein